MLAMSLVMRMIWLSWLVWRPWIEQLAILWDWASWASTIEIRSSLLSHVGVWSWLHIVELILCPIELTLEVRPVLLTLGEARVLDRAGRDALSRLWTELPLVLMVRVEG